MCGGCPDTKRIDSWHQVVEIKFVIENLKIFEYTKAAFIFSASCFYFKAVVLKLKYFKTLTRFVIYVKMCYYKR